jgi:hypothetical protein
MVKKWGGNFFKNEQVMGFNNGLPTIIPHHMDLIAIVLSLSEESYMLRYFQICLLCFFICPSYILASEILPDKPELDRNGSMVYQENVPLTSQLTTVQKKTKPVYFGLIGAPIRKEAELNRYQPLKTDSGTYYVSSILMPVADPDSPLLIIKSKLGYVIHDSSGHMIKKDIPKDQIDQEFRKAAKNPAKL